MTSAESRAGALAGRVLAPVDALLNRLYGSRFNPLYLSGALTVVLLGVVLVTGLYLIFFYRLSAPYESVARITGQAWLGRWIRSLHRYASDAAVITAVVHMFRMYAQRRSWGPRALAWLAGLVLLFVLFACGWTGYVMVWDVQGIVLAREGARLLDVMPLFSEPIARTFVGERPLPSAFFFLNLFLHVALPVGMGLLLWIHVTRLARPKLAPPRGLVWSVIGLLTALSVLWPIGIAPPADTFRLAERAPFDAFYAFWLPFVQAVPARVAWAVGGAAAAALIFVPLWSKPRPAARPEPSVVDERLCTGCRQCYLDCPYEAIAMVERSDDRDDPVARVDPARCVSCGICAGSCAPMGLGPPGRTGRDQLKAVRAFLAAHPPDGRDVVVIACTRGAGGVARDGHAMGAAVFPVECAGSLHTSVVEHLVREGVGGVLIASCPTADCWNREGAAWLDQRLYHNREAELQARVDRRRVRVVDASQGQRQTVLDQLAAFRSDIAQLDAPVREGDAPISAECNPPVPEEVEA